MDFVKGGEFHRKAPKKFFGSPLVILLPLFNKTPPLFQVKGSPSKLFQNDIWYTSAKMTLIILFMYKTANNMNKRAQFYPIPFWYINLHMYKTEQHSQHFPNVRKLQKQAITGNQDGSVLSNTIVLIITP